MSESKNKSYSTEFKKEAVRLALESGKPKASVAKDLGISLSLLYSWINKQTKANTKGMSVEEMQAESKRLRELEAENKRLKTEMAILKKAAAYFAKEQL